MSFAYTTTTVFDRIENMSLQHEQILATLLQRYEYEQETSRYPSRAFLLEAQSVLEQRLAEIPLDHEILVLADAIYNHLGMYQEIILLLKTFLKTPCSHGERAWAIWHLVDYLSLSECYDLSVDEQQKFLLWARETMSPESCFFVLSDGTQALSWLKSGVIDQWFQHIDHLFAIAPRTEHNRLDRFYTLRTAIMLCLRVPDLAQARVYFELLSRLENEQPLWPERTWVHMERQILELKRALLQENEAAMYRIVHEAQQELLVWEEQLQKQESKEIQRFRSLQHNMGAPLYQAKQYNLAIPFFQKAVAYQTTAYYSYLWLAVCLWQTTKAQENALPLLRQAACRFDESGDPWNTFQRLPELESFPFETE